MEMGGVFVGEKFGELGTIVKFYVMQKSTFSAVFSMFMMDGSNKIILYK